jgi:hypothetical protein
MDTFGSFDPETRKMTAAPQFTDPGARHAWSDYFREVDRRLRPLGASRRREIRDELVAHILDGLDAEQGESESERLVAVLARMGSPASYLDGILEEAVLAAETDPGWRLGQRVRSLGRTVGLAATYLLGLFAFLLIVGKFFWPAEVGVFRLSTGWIVAGYVDNAGAVDLLGFWLIPVMIALVAVFWVVLPRVFDGRR